MGGGEVELLPPSPAMAMAGPLSGVMGGRGPGRTGVRGWKGEWGAGRAAPISWPEAGPPPCDCC